MVDLDLALRHINELDLPKADHELQHFFFDGVYMRSLFLPAGTFVIGKRHKKPMLNVLASGRMALLMGDKIKEIAAPYMSMGKVGRKAGYAIEDSVWSNIIVTNLTDVAQIEAEYVTEGPVCLS